MGYVALYRKMRPKNFEQVVGQEHIVKTLCNQIKTDRINHAYLFCGTRGTGKTSTAKIFAKAINCQNSCDGQPCGECSMCVSADEGRSMNIIEIDAASNNSVDNIRDIREEVKYPPTEGKYKVYIIDEVHMLSIGAFNALLKTLEEPPSHVIFILATTDPQKIPITILSRCQRFDFKRISSNDIAKTLRVYMDKEGVSVDDDALSYIASVSDGAMRDALSIIDQCTAFYFDEHITLDKVLETCGSVDSQVFFDMTDALFLQDGERCMNIIREIVLNGRDIGQFVNELIAHFRNVLVAASVGIDSHALDFSAEKTEKFREQGVRVEKGFLIELINIFSELQAGLKYASNARILFEVQCIRICNPIGAESFEEIKAELRNIEKRLDEGNFEVKPMEESSSGLTKPESKKPKPKAVPDDIKEVIGQWKQFASDFKDLEKAIIESVVPEFLEDKFYIVCGNAAHLGQISRMKEKIDEKLEKRFGKKFDIFIISKADFDAKCGNFDMSDRDDAKNKEDILNKINADIIWD